MKWTTLLLAVSLPPMNDRLLYSVYGLRVLSDHVLPLPAAAGGSPDLILTDGGFIPPDVSKPLPRKLHVEWFSSGCGACLRYRDVGGELLEYRYTADGRQMEILRTRTNLDVTAVTVGVALGAALFLRGTPVLHATAIMINSHGVLVAGNSGAGKSTLSAALLARGAALLTDDLAALAFVGKEVISQPGFPRMKLFKDSGVVTGMKAEHWPRVFDCELSDDKRWLDVNELPGGFHSEPGLMEAVYLLEGRCRGLDKPHIEQLHPREASIALTRHFFGERFLDISLKTRLSLAVRIAERIQVSRVLMPDDLGSVSTVAEMIIGEMPLPGEMPLKEAHQRFLRIEEYNP